MTIEFSIIYNTSSGEGLVLNTGNKRYEMINNGNGLWKVKLPAAAIEPGSEYSYAVMAAGVERRREWRGHRAPELGAEAEAYSAVRVRDFWRDRPEDVPFWSSAFTEVIFGRKKSENALATGKAKDANGGEKERVRLRVEATQIRPGWSLGITGEGEELGNWTEARPLCDKHFPEWEARLSFSKRVEYKFVIIDDSLGKIIHWETGPNRVFWQLEADNQLFILSQPAPKFEIEPWRGVGTAIPVFSLRSEDSFGVGEFLDLKKMADLVASAGHNVIQLLPINDTTMTRSWMDSYPYNAVSSFALHPQYLHLPAIGLRKDAHYKKLKEELNQEQKLDYQRVNQEKERLTRKVFKTKGEQTLKSADFQEYVKKNADWLTPYAAFSVLRDDATNADFRQWGKNSKCTKALLKRLSNERKSEIEYYYFVQYHLHCQLKEAVEYAHSKGVILKGDLPIGVSRDSVDSWWKPELFNMDSQVGAPPDDFALDGQNWGFPSYNWERMAQDNYAWWKARLRKMSEYFDAFRIDHILGFFRIWEIPIPYKSGLMGHFHPALPYSIEELKAAGFDPEIDSKLFCGVKSAKKDAENTDFLFVEDPRQLGYYHPRISANLSKCYEGLEPERKQAFNALYDNFFYSRHNEFWKNSAYSKLPALLDSTSMLACGEDLGMIPACVPETMHNLALLSLEVQRMPKLFGQEFGVPALYPYLSVCTTGSHDTSTLRAWWEEDRSRTERYFSKILGGGDASHAPLHCEPYIAEAIIAEHLSSPSMLCILPLQDWLAIDGNLSYKGSLDDERINIPVNPRHYWRYRMHCTLESLLSDAPDAIAFRKKLSALSAKRNHS